MLSQHELISTLTSLPAREFAEVVSVALDKRDSGSERPHRDDARLRLAEALRFADAGRTPSAREVVAQTRRQSTGDSTSRGAPSTPHGGCCGLTFTSHAKKIICPLCGKQASAM